MSTETILAEIAAERRRQVEEEGWTPEHDDKHTNGELPKAAACYALGDPAAWPKEWSLTWWKPKNRRRDLIRSCALLIAEIERLDRAKAKAACQCCGGSGMVTGIGYFGEISDPEALANCPVCSGLGRAKAKEAGDE